MENFSIKALNTETWKDFARQIFERAGFSYESEKGKNHCIMRKTL
jgi:hypothetical protein